MLDDRRSSAEVSPEIESLRAQLAEARETIRAIRAGEVDAIVAETESGDRVFTLKSADHPYRVFIEQMNQGAATLSRDGDVLYCNHALGELLGEPLVRLIGAHIAEFITEADRDAFLEMVQLAVGGPRTRAVDRASPRRDGSRGEFELVTAAGERIPAYLSIFSFPEGEAPVVCLLVTDLRDTRASEALKRSDDRYKTFIRLSSEAIWRFEFDEPIATSAPEDEQVKLLVDRAFLAECNDAMARMYGYERAEELSGVRITSMLDRSEPANTEFLRAFVRSGYRLADGESCELDRNGFRRYFLNNLTGIVEDGRLLRVWGTQRDITAQREAQRALDRERELLQSIIDTIPVMITLYRPDASVLRVNPEFVRRTGWTTDDAAGGMLIDRIYPDPEQRARVRSFMESFGGRWLDLKMRTRDGRDLETSWANIRLSDGTQVGIGIDISERKRTEAAILNQAAELNAQAVELSRSNRDLEDFAHVAAHDLKEPLRGIRNVSSFLVEDYGPLLGAAGMEKLATLDRLAKRMHDLLDALLSYALAGRSDLSVAPTDLNVIVAEAAVTLRSRLEKENGKLEIVEPLPTVLCDRILMGQVVVNLISNALKYNHSPQKRIEVGVRPGDPAPVIYVRDNGIGIAEKHHSLVFGIFKRLHTSTMYGGGAGAGLAIVKKIIERHGGRVWVESTEGAGATFCFTLGTPVARPT